MHAWEGSEKGGHARPHGHARAAAAAVLALLAALLCVPVHAGHSAGHIAFVAKACTNCHADPINPYPAMLNAANAGGIITHAVGQNMFDPYPDPVFVGSELADIASYINSVLPAVPAQPVAFNSGSPVVATSLVLPNLYYNTSWGALNAATGGSAVNGTVTFPAGAGATRSASFTPTACQAGGTGSFQFRGTGPVWSLQELHAEVQGAA